MGLQFFGKRVFSLCAGFLEGFAFVDNLPVMVGITLSRTLGIFLGLLTAVRAESATCSQVSTGTSIQKFQGLDIGYTSEQLNYW